MLFRPARATDLDEVCALLTTTRHTPRAMRALLTADPTFVPERIRIAWTGGRIVACAVVYPRLLHIGSAVVPVGGIGNVRTDPRLWGRGIATALLRECLTAMQQEGLLLAPLFSRRHDLFLRRGWHVLPSPHLTLPVAALGALALGGKNRTAAVRRLEAADLDELVALYDLANAERTGSTVRDRAVWIGRLTALDAQGAVLLVAQHGPDLAGYLAAQMQGESAEVLELLPAPWDEDAVWLDLLRSAARIGEGIDTVGAVLPTDYMRLIDTALPQRATLDTSDDLLMRVVDPLPLLTHLQPLLAERLRLTPLSEEVAVRLGPLRGGAILRAWGSEVSVEPTRRSDDVPALSEPLFLALLFGAVAGVARLEATELPPETHSALLTLFPPQEWIYWRSDAF